LGRVVLLSLMAYGLVLLGLAILRGELLVLALPLFLYLLAGLAFSPGNPKVEAQRSLSASRVSPGFPVTVTITVTNHGERLERVWLADTMPAELEKVEGETRLFTTLPPGGQAQLEYVVRAQRGTYDFQPLIGGASEQFGLVQRRLRLPAEGSFAVFPQVLRLPSIPIKPRLTRNEPGLNPARQGGPGVSFFGVREYQLGDALRQVNWRATARHPETVYSNEFELERSVDIGIILDARQDSYFEIGGRSLFEHAVVAAASLAQAFLHDGNRVGMMHYGQYLGWVFPGYGKIQRERILFALAQARPGDSLIDHMENLPIRFFPPRSQIVLVSPLQMKDTEVLLKVRARGYSMLIISPDPLSFEMAFMPENDVTRLAERIARLERLAALRELQLSGIRTLDWNTSVPFDQAVLPITRGQARFVRRNS